MVRKGFDAPSWIMRERRKKKPKEVAPAAGGVRELMERDEEETKVFAYPQKIQESSKGNPGFPLIFTPKEKKSRTP